MGAILKWIITYAIVRAAVSMGVGIVTYGAVIVFLNEAIKNAKELYNTFPATILDFLALAGMPQVIGILLGALLARASLTFVRRLALIG
jgi:hypothetical protein